MEKQQLTRKQFAELLGVEERYLVPSNYEHYKGGAKEKGYNLISREGRGEKAIFVIEAINDLPNEIWKNIPNYPEYQASNLGRIKSPQGGILTGTKHRGYIRVRIKDQGQLSVHRLILMAFCPIENSELYVVDHINGKRDDNRIENLRWVWQGENSKFSDENNTKMKEILAKLVQKYGYDNTVEQLNKLL